jgi:ATP-binding cassette, subfamily B, bacterial PglK
MKELLHKALYLLSFAKKKSLIKIILVLIFIGILEALAIISVYPLIAILAEPELIQTNKALNSLYYFFDIYFPLTTNSFLYLLSFGTIFISLISSFFKIYSNYRIYVFTSKMQSNLSLLLMKTYLKKPYEFFLKRHSADLTKNILSEASRVSNSIFLGGLELIASIAILIISLGLLVIIDGFRALIVLFMFGLVYALIFLTFNEKIKLNGLALFNYNESRFNSVIEILSGIKVIKLSKDKKFYYEGFNKQSTRYNEAHAIGKTISIIPQNIVEFFLVTVGVIFSILILNNSSNSVGLGFATLALYIIAAYKIKPAVQKIYSSLAGITHASKSLQAVYDEIHLNNYTYDSEETIQDEYFKNDLTIKNVSYCYPKSSKKVIDNFSLKIPNETSLGVVGLSGSGKSTLVNIILGLLEPQEGYLSLGDIKIQPNNTASWQSRIGYVPQDIFLLNTTLAENIAIGVPLGDIDLGRVMKCLKLAQLSQFVNEELANGLNTIIGERGSNLSGGQKQRVGIARALYTNPKIIILDEASSDLDVVTEKRFIEVIDKIKENIMVIIITHKITTIKNCDKIIILENGKILDSGKYDYLKSYSNFFNKLDNDV